MSLIRKTITRNKITDTLENILTEVFERTHKCPWYKRHRSGKFSYELVYHSIGVSTIVRCNKCGKEFNVTNYDNWKLNES